MKKGLTLSKGDGKVSQEPHSQNSLQRRSIQVPDHHIPCLLVVLCAFSKDDLFRDGRLINVMVPGSTRIHCQEEYWRLVHDIIHKNGLWNYGLDGVEVRVVEIN